MAAQQADANAFVEWAGSKNKLAEAQAALDKLQSTQPDVVRDNTEMASAQARHDDLKARIEHDAAFVPVIPIDPDSRDAVQITGLRANRLHIEYGIAAFFAVSSLLLIVRSRRNARVSSGRGHQHDSQDDHHTPISRQPLTAA